MWRTDTLTLSPSFLGQWHPCGCFFLTFVSSFPVRWNRPRRYTLDSKLWPSPPVRRQYRSGSSVQYCRVGVCFCSLFCFVRRSVVIRSGGPNPECETQVERERRRFAGTERKEETWRGLRRERRGQLNTNPPGAFLLAPPFTFRRPNRLAARGVCGGGCGGGCDLVTKRACPIVP